MITYIKHKDIDKERWDACIRGAANSRMYAYSWYLDCVTGGQWDALVADDYQLVFPLPSRVKAGISYVYTPFFIQQLGAFASPAPDMETMQELLQAIPSTYKLVDLNLNGLNDPGKLPPVCDMKLSMKPNYELMLDHDYGHLQKNYSANLKRNIKKAAGDELSIIAGGAVDTIIALFRAERGSQLRRWKDPEYLLFKQLVETCRQHLQVDIREAHDRAGNFVAGAIFFVSSERVVLIFSATGEQAKARGAMPFLIDHVIRDYAGKKMLLDFEGSCDPGLARFYAGFGSAKTLYPHIYRDHLPLVVYLAKRLKAFVGR